ncbi:hypothetical protein MKW98_019901 [Papaver atlanticum]|uniref:Uncharacterized protein n=1 Tax=Papaver atlanticum TaxID=357466 RepID=A0AAD4S0Q1_9MAGN|nr:hypothetical protein MKW98_019901 [Papaver atlanticum]
MESLLNLLILQHMAPYIEVLEEQMQKLHEEREVAVLERRTANNADEMMEIKAPLSVAMLEGGKTAAVRTAGTPSFCDAIMRAGKIVASLNGGWSGSSSTMKCRMQLCRGT